MTQQKATAALMGIAVGDALGVPFEFMSRSQMNASPAKDMIGYGTHNQPPGTWSDDSSLTFCLAESLIHGYSLQDIAARFINWKNWSYWTARDEVFDIGMTTSKSISELENILRSGQIEALKNLKELAQESDNGNGSLMRILPLLFYLKGKDSQDQFGIIWDVSALTHKHIRAAMSCFIYLKFAEKLLSGTQKEKAYQQTREDVLALWDRINFPVDEQQNFARLIQNDIQEVPKNTLKSGGYVIEVLESSFWFFLKKSNYESTVLGIINLGHDTDTAAAIVGGIAGIYYGLEGIPEYWIVSLSKMEEIMELGERLGNLEE